MELVACEKCQRTALCVKAVCVECRDKVPSAAAPFIRARTMSVLLTVP